MLATSAPSTNDTRNALTEFDLCVALAQESLNSQIKTGWRRWLAASEFEAEVDPGNFNGTIHVYPVNPDTGKPLRYGLQATIAPFEMNLNVPNGKLGQVQVSLTLISGQVDYYSETKELHLSQPIENWKISFVTDLDKRPMDWDTLKRTDPQAYDTGQQIVAQSSLPESVFSIECLVMQFSKVDLVSNAAFDVPEDVPFDAVTKARAMLHLLLTGKGGDFMLGTVVRRSKSRSGAIPTFALTDTVFDVHPDQDPRASTLSYLGMFCKHPLPADLDTARSALLDNWVRPGMLDGTISLVSGVMAISKHALIDNYLIPLFTEQFGPFNVELTTDPSGLRWTYKRSQSDMKHTKDIIHHRWNRGNTEQLDVAIMPGTNQLTISGKIESHVQYEGRTLDMGIFGGGDRTEAYYYYGHQDIKASLVLTGKGGSLDFKVEANIPEENYFGDVVVDRAEVFGFAKVYEGVFDAAEWTGIVAKTPGELIEKAMKDMLNVVKNVLQGLLKQIDVSCAQHAFIPPGGGVFTFQNLRFSDAGDVLLDIIYQAS